MTENKEKHCNRNKAKDKTNENDKSHEKDKEQHESNNVFTQLMDVMSAAAAATATAPSSARSSPRGLSPSSIAPRSIAAGRLSAGETELLSPFYGTAGKSFHSEILLLDVDTSDFRPYEYNNSNKEESFGTQRVYKKTSPNCVLTMYLPTREISLVGNNSSILSGIVFVDPKAIQGYRVYAQLTLTFRYGREDEEVMGLRFCNEAIMSLHQVWPRNEEPSRESLSPLQDALVKRLGVGAHPFTLTLTPNAPPSVQLVPAKRYYGAPIGTSYDVRCFIANKTDEKFHRRASVKMNVRVIYRADVFHSNGLDNIAAALFNSSRDQQAASSPLTAALTTPPAINTKQVSTTSSTSDVQESIVNISSFTATESSPTDVATIATTATATATAAATTTTTSSTSSSSCANNKLRKSERVESFSRLRLSPKAFRFSGRFGRSKSEIEKCPNESFYNYSKSFQECDSVGGGPQGAVDKPFLLQDGRVGLRASLDKAWYTHGEDVCVTVNIRNDSRKTVRKIRVCAIQHVDVCMFNNGKFKNIVADSDNTSPVDRTVPPGGTLNTSIVLKPQRGPTKNWIALEDTLQRSTEPEEITGFIAASAIRSPIVLSKLQGSCSPSPNMTTGHFRHQQQQQQEQQQHRDMILARFQLGNAQQQQHGDDRNVFAIYVSYYVKVKLTLSGMGGELSLKLPFVLVHIDEEQRQQRELSLAQEVTNKIALSEVPTATIKSKDCANNNNAKGGNSVGDVTTDAASSIDVFVENKNEGQRPSHEYNTSTMEEVDDDFSLHLAMPPTMLTAAEITTKTEKASKSSATRMNSNNNKRRLVRSETLARDEDAEKMAEGGVEEDDGRKTEATINEETCEMDNIISRATATTTTTTATATTTTTTATTTTTLETKASTTLCNTRFNSMTIVSDVEESHVHVVQIHRSNNTSQEQ